MVVYFVLNSLCQKALVRSRNLLKILEETAKRYLWCGKRAEPQTCVLGLLCTEIRDSHRGRFCLSCSQLSGWGALGWLLGSCPLLFKDLVFSTLLFSNLSLLVILCVKSTCRNSSVPSSVLLLVFCMVVFLPGSQRALTKIILPVAVRRPGAMNFFQQLVVCCTSIWLVTKLQQLDLQFKYASMYC